MHAELTGVPFFVCFSSKMAVNYVISTPFIVDGFDVLDENTDTVFAVFPTSRDILSFFKVVRICISIIQ